MYTKETSIRALHKIIIVNSFQTRKLKLIWAFPPLIEAAVGCFAYTAQALATLAGIRDAP